MNQRMQSISLAEARRLVLHSSGLASGLVASPFGSGKEGALRAIEHLGYVQIDTISVVERAHHHVIWSRVPDYRPPVLHELQSADRRVYEYWSHAASYLPIRDYRYSLPRMRAIASGKRHWFRRKPKVMAQVLERIRNEGALMAKDFEAPAGARGGPWFEWKPAKKALDQLFMEGALAIRERRGFQKVYDLTERVIPSSVDLSVPTPKELAIHLVRSALRSHGIATDAEIRYLRKGLQVATRRALRELTQSKEIVPLKIEGIEATYYAATRALEASWTSPIEPARVSILSPFDNLVIQRKRLNAIFGFDYQIECYVPEKKRKFGYFCLPLLQGERFVGRIDAKADRATGILRVQSVHLDPGDEKGLVGKKLAAQLRDPLTAALRDFAEFNGCHSVSFASSQPFSDKRKR